MFSRFIVASSDRQQLDSWRIIVGRMKAELAPEASIIDCDDADVAELNWRRKPSRRDLLILDSALGRRSSSEDRGSAAANLIVQLHEEEHPPASILIGRSDPTLLDRLPENALVERLPLLRPTDVDLFEELPPLAKRLAKRRDAPAAPASSSTDSTWALLDVNLKSPQASISLFIGTGERLDDVFGSQDIDIDPIELKNVVRESRRLRQNLSRRQRDDQALAGWHKEYAKVGARIFKLVHRDDFPEYLWRAMQAGKANTRIRFALDSEAYDGLWEAMYNQRKNQWLIEKSMVTRRARLNEYPTVRSLDGGDGRIHVLAIASDVRPWSSLSGPSNQGFRKWRASLEDDAWKRLKHEPSEDEKINIQDIFEPLNALRREMTALEDLKKKHDKGGMGNQLEIDFLDAPNEVPLHLRVQNKLREGCRRSGRAVPYDVVHFAGHASFDVVPGMNNRGYLLFGNHGTETHAVPISDFASWLEQGQVQLAYLNCCRSSAPRAAQELANRKIPLAIGFSWDLANDHAIEFATTFYDELLSNQLKVCQAFKKAKDRLYSHHQEDGLIWAAPVLVAQPERWEEVETCFAGRIPNGPVAVANGA